MLDEPRPVLRNRTKRPGMLEPGLDREPVPEARDRRHEARRGELAGEVELVGAVAAEAREPQQPRAILAPQQELAALLLRVRRRPLRLRGEAEPPPFATGKLDRRRRRRAAEIGDPALDAMTGIGGAERESLEADDGAAGPRPSRAMPRARLRPERAGMAWEEMNAARRDAAILEEVGDAAERAAREPGSLVDDREGRSGLELGGELLGQRKLAPERVADRPHGDGVLLPGAGCDRRREAGPDAAQADDRQRQSGIWLRRLDVALGIERIEGVALRPADLERFRQHGGRQRLKHAAPAVRRARESRSTTTARCRGQAR